MRDDAGTATAELGRSLEEGSRWWSDLAGPLEKVMADVRRRVDRTAYRAQQYAIAAPIGVLRRALALTSGEQKPDRGSLAALGARYEALLERDLANVEAGLY